MIAFILQQHGTAGKCNRAHFKQRMKTSFQHKYDILLIDMAKGIKRILLVLHLGGASGRELLSGIFSFIKPKMHWHTRILADLGLLTDSERVSMLATRIDGIITSEPAFLKSARVALMNKMPLVVIGQSEAHVRGTAHRTTFVHNDDFGIGRTAARYFMSLGDFSSFIFVSAEADTYWSDERKRGFLAGLGEGGKVCSVVRTTSNEENDADMKRLAAALAAAPKPCAVFAAWDGKAIQVSDVCSEQGLEVPTQVAILGVDNDELICDYAHPSLSSIKPDHRKVGYTAAAELARLLNGRARGVRSVICHGQTVVERESTRALPPAAELVRRALRFIDQHAVEGISARDVVAHLGVSRRLADLRFRQIEHTSLGKLIAQRKSDAVAERLVRTDHALRRIASECGFATLKHLQRQFKARFGESMTAYRSSHST